jgi:hypothetical protein
MTLYEKIINIYPNLTPFDFGLHGTIELQNDGELDFIKSWENANPEPTVEQLNAITG